MSKSIPSGYENFLKPKDTRYRCPLCDELAGNHLVGCDLNNVITLSNGRTSTNVIDARLNNINYKIKHHRNDKVVIHERLVNEKGKGKRKLKFTKTELEYIIKACVTMKGLAKEKIAGNEHMSTKLILSQPYYESQINNCRKDILIYTEIQQIVERKVK